MLAFLSFLVICYTVFIALSILGWLKLAPPKISLEYQPQTYLSVLIPVRNEAGNILKLLEDLLAQTYPNSLFEVLLIDDHSDDETIFLAKQFREHHPAFNLTVLRLENGRGSGKKSALSFGLNHANGTLIVQTDGDCRVQPDWLKLLEATYQQKQTKFISGPVCLENNGGIFSKMQVVEFASLIGTGAAAIGSGFPNMCNGANLAFEKEAFYAVNGYTGNETIASGDDEFLMHKIHKLFPGSVTFLKAPEAIVFTPTQPNLKAFLQQRIRWASKWKFYKNIAGQLLALLIFLVNAGLLAGFISWVAGGLNGPAFWWWFIIKSGADIVFLGLILKFCRRLSLLVYFLPLQLVYIPYVVYCALAGLKGNYHWKGRNHQNA